MVENPIFTWKELDQDNDKVVVAIKTSESRVRVDRVTAEAMEKIQREIIKTYPDRAIRLLINTEGLYLDPSLINNIIRPEFIFSLVSLSGSFNMLVLYGKQAVQTIAKTLAGIVPGHTLGHLHLARDEAEALKIAHRAEFKPNSVNKA
jgi:hypothetical protein